MKINEIKVSTPIYLKFNISLTLKLMCLVFFFFIILIFHAIENMFNLYYSFL